MAKVPVFQESQVEELKPTPIDPRTAATLGGEVIDLGEGISALGDHLQKVQNDTDVRNGLTGFTKDTIDIHNQVSKESDLTAASQKAQDLLEKAQDKRASQIKDADARQKFLDRSSLQMDRSFTSINSMIAAKQLQQSRISLKDSGEMFVSAYAGMSRPEQMQSLVNEFSKEVDTNVENGVTPKWLADEYKKQTIYKAKYAQANHDIDIDAPNTLKQLELGDKGIHPDLTTTDRDKLIERANSKIQRDDEKSKKLLDIAQKKNLGDLLMKNTVGINVDQQAEEMFFKQQISEAGYKKLQDNGVSPHALDAKTNPESYLGASKMLMDPKISDDDKIGNLIQLNTDGKLSTSDMKNLFQLHLLPNKEGDGSLEQTTQGKKDMQLLNQAEKDDKQLKERSQGLQGAWDRITGHNDNPHNVSDLMQKLYDNLSKEKNITPDVIEQKTTEIINKDNMKRNPGLANLPKEGHTVMNNHTGKIYWAVPDGKGGVRITPYNGTSNSQ